MKPRSRWMFKGGKLKAHILEEDVVEEITTRLWWEYRIKVWRVRERLPGMGKMSEAGIPDLMGWVPDTDDPKVPGIPIPLFIEVKRPLGGVRRAAQERFISEAHSAGCVAFFAGSWAKVVEELAKHGITNERRAA